MRTCVNLSLKSVGGVTSYIVAPPPFYRLEIYLVKINTKLIAYSIQQIVVVTGPEVLYLSLCQVSVTNALLFTTENFKMRRSRSALFTGQRFEFI